ncbi:hypothetical protein EJ03DRAFT_102035 [Teratosphaeria nubilosa]|uniref:Uncharacterized protein n=1 Tax=Teratosphaeria nubilosa TaxID=161662 RepID=A0A6G1LLV4_9PEZI|nr:hypothetical protein EJ03DRAFT_102035 [Teratosphaeria nubilosa]
MTCTQSAASARVAKSDLLPNDSWSTAKPCHTLATAAEPRNRGTLSFASLVGHSRQPRRSVHGRDDISRLDTA